MEEIELEVPVEPPHLSVVLAADGIAWQRFGETWTNCAMFAFLGNGLTWANLLISKGPVRVIHWAPVEEAA